MINADSDYVVIAGTLISIGGTTTLTALTKFIYDVDFRGNEVAYKAYKRLKKYAHIVRRDHNLQLILEKVESTNCFNEPMILVRGVHKYKLFNKSFIHLLPIHFEVYTEIGRQCGKIKSGGFERILINHVPLSDYELQESLVTKHHKQYFELKTAIQKQKEIQLEYHTCGFFQLKDQLIWTVQDLSENFHVEIINKTGYLIRQFDKNENRNNNEIIFKINHHQEDIISQNKVIYSKDDKGNG